MNPFASLLLLRVAECKVLQPFVATCHLEMPEEEEEEGKPHTEVRVFNLSAEVCRKAGLTVTTLTHTTEFSVYAGQLQQIVVSATAPPQAQAQAGASATSGKKL